MPNYQKGVFGVFPLLIYSITKSTKIPKYLKCCVPCFALAYATIRSVRQMADVWLTYRPPNIVLLFTNVLYLGVTRALAGEGVRTTWQMFLMQLPLEAVLRVVDSGNVYSLFLFTRRRGANTAHTQMGRPTHEAPTREYLALLPKVHSGSQERSTRG